MKELTELYKKYKYIVWPIFSGLASVIVLVFIIIPQFLGYLKSRDEISQTNNHLNSLVVKAEELKQIDGEGTRKKLETAYVMLPSDQDIPKTLAILQDRVNKSSLQLKNTNFVTSRKPGDNHYQLNLSVSGPIDYIRNFLIGLEDSPQIFQVDSINVHFQSVGLGVDADIPISVYFQPPKKAVVALDQPISTLTTQEESLLSKFEKLTAGFSGASGDVTSSVPLGKLDPFD